VNGDGYVPLRIVLFAAAAVFEPERRLMQISVLGDKRRIRPRRCCGRPGVFCTSSSKTNNKRVHVLWVVLFVGEECSRGGGGGGGGQLWHFVSGGFFLYM